MPVVYQNPYAVTLFQPDSKQAEAGEPLTLRGVLGVTETEYRRLCQRFKGRETLEAYGVLCSPPTGARPVFLSLSRLELEGERYVQVCADTACDDQAMAQARAEAFTIAHTSKTTEDGLRNLLDFTARYLAISRIVILETVEKMPAVMTYHWCAEGTAPLTGEGEPERKVCEYYQERTSGDLVVEENVGSLPPEAQALLAPLDIHAFVLMPLKSNDVIKGILCVEDCLASHQWTVEELQIVHDLASMLAALLVRRNIERGVQYSLEILNTVTNHCDNIVTVSDLTTDRLLFCNRAISKAIGLPEASLEGWDYREVMEKFIGVYPTNSPRDEMVDPTGKVIKREMVWELENEREDQWYLVRDSIINWIDGQAVRIETATEITRQKEYEAHLEYIASTDMLTGVYNRNWGSRLVKRILSSRTSGQPGALVFLDLDDLKSINDRYGHEEGDHMITKTVEIIRSCIRRSDVVCRWGGDEFLLIIRATPQQAERIMDKIQEQLTAYNETGKRPYQIAFSYGVVELTNAEGETVDTLVAKADKKMYLHKMSKK